jgi:F-type H+-transporting ATPase subunit delta
MSELRLDAVTRRYTSALFDLALKKGAEPDVRRDVENLGRELSVPAVEGYLFDTRVPLEDRRAKLGPLLAEMHPLTQNFIALLFDKRREEVLRHLPQAYRLRQMVEERAAEGVVESPAPLSDDELGKLSSALSRKLDKTVRLENRVVPELIAGVRVTADNRMIDYSARGRLDGLRRNLISAPLPSAPGA